MPVRLKDIARDLNLSKMTISKVLRGQTDVSADTKARVLQRAKELNYRPNTTARTLRTGQTFMIGMVVPAIGESFLAEITEGIDQVIRSAGYGLMVCPSQQDPKNEERLVELMLSRQVDAILVAPMDESAPFFERLGKNQTVPLICLNRRLSGPSENFVGINEQEVGRIACEHLLAMGSRRIGYLRGPHTPVGDNRYLGYREALTNADHAFHPELVVDAMGTDCSEYTRGFEGMLKLLMARTRPDGVMAYSDIMAVGAIDAALSRNIKIPEGIAFVGCGNDPMVCEMRVPLSSVVLPGQEVGQRAARMALRLIANPGKAENRKILISPKLAERKSSMRCR
ncbi:MAG: LacI family DNA-binding transcriptional regulator [Terracidiphilus sp.]